MIGAIAMFLKRWGGEGFETCGVELSQLKTFSKRVSVIAHHFPIREDNLGDDHFDLSRAGCCKGIFSFFFCKGRRIAPRQNN